MDARCCICGTPAEAASVLHALDHVLADWIHSNVETKQSGVPISACTSCLEKIFKLMEIYDPNYLKHVQIHSRIFQLLRRTNHKSTTKGAHGVKTQHMDFRAAQFHGQNSPHTCLELTPYQNGHNPGSQRDSLPSFSELISYQNNQNPGSQYYTPPSSLKLMPHQNNKNPGSQRQSLPAFLELTSYQNNQNPGSQLDSPPSSLELVPYQNDNNPGPQRPSLPSFLELKSYQNNSNPGSQLDSPPSSLELVPYQNIDNPGSQLNSPPSSLKLVPYQNIDNPRSQLDSPPSSFELVPYQNDNNPGSQHHSLPSFLELKSYENNSNPGSQLDSPPSSLELVPYQNIDNPGSQCYSPPSFLELAPFYQNNPNPDSQYYTPPSSLELVPNQNNDNPSSPCETPPSYLELAPYKNNHNPGSQLDSPIPSVELISYQNKDNPGSQLDSPPSSMELISYQKKDNLGSQCDSPPSYLELAPYKNNQNPGSQLDSPPPSVEMIPYQNKDNPESHSSITSLKNPTAQFPDLYDSFDLNDNHNTNLSVTFHAEPNPIPAPEIEAPANTTQLPSFSELKQSSQTYYCETFHNESNCYQQPLSTSPDVNSHQQVKQNYLGSEELDLISQYPVPDLPDLNPEFEVPRLENSSLSVMHHMESIRCHIESLPGDWSVVDTVKCTTTTSYSYNVPSVAPSPLDDWLHDSTVELESQEAHKSIISKTSSHIKLQGAPSQAEGNFRNTSVICNLDEAQQHHQEICHKQPVPYEEFGPNEHPVPYQQPVPYEHPVSYEQPVPYEQPGHYEQPVSYEQLSPYEQLATNEQPVPYEQSDFYENPAPYGQPVPHEQPVFKHQYLEHQSPPNTHFEVVTADMKCSDINNSEQHALTRPKPKKLALELPAIRHQYLEHPSNIPPPFSMNFSDTDEELQASSEKILRFCQELEPPIFKQEYPPNNQSEDIMDYSDSEVQPLFEISRQRQEKPSPVLELQYSEYYYHSSPNTQSPHSVTSSENELVSKPDHNLIIRSPSITQGHSPSSGVDENQVNVSDSLKPRDLDENAQSVPETLQQHSEVEPEWPVTNLALVHNLAQLRSLAKNKQKKPSTQTCSNNPDVFMGPDKKKLKLEVFKPQDTKDCGFVLSAPSDNEEHHISLSCPTKLNSPGVRSCLIKRPWLPADKEMIKLPQHQPNSDVGKVPLTFPQQPKVVCAYCNKSYANPLSLRRHQRNIHAEQMENGLKQSTVKTALPPKQGKSLLKQSPVNPSENGLEQSTVEPASELALVIYQPPANKKKSPVKKVSQLALTQQQQTTQVEKPSLSVNKKTSSTELERKKAVEEQNIPVIIESKSNYICSTCKKFYGSTSALSRHIKKEHPEAFLQRQKNATVKKQQKKRKRPRPTGRKIVAPDARCIFCAETFFHSFLLQQHVRIVHPGEYKTHTNIIDFYQRKSGSSTEQQQHSSEFSQCEYCGQVFVSEYNLDIHMEVYHLEDQLNYPEAYPCSICEFVCIGERGLEEHFKAFHESQLVFRTDSTQISTVCCKLCEKRCENVLEFNDHLKQMHKKIGKLNSVVNKNKSNKTEFTCVGKSKFSQEICKSPSTEVVPENIQLASAITEVVSANEQLAPVSTEHFPASTQTASTSMQIIPASTEVVPENIQLASAITEVSANEQLASTITEVVPASTQTASTSMQIVPANTEVVLVNEQLSSANTELVPANEQLASVNTEHESASIQSASAIMQIVPANTEVVSANEQLASVNTELVPANEQLASTTIELVPANEQLASTITELVPANEQLASTTIELVPANEQLASTITELVPANEQLSSANTELVPVNMQPVCTNIELVSVNTQTASTSIQLVSTSTQTDSTNIQPVSTNAQLDPASTKLLANTQFIATNAQTVCTSMQLVSSSNAQDSSCEAKTLIESPRTSAPFLTSQHNECKNILPASTPGPASPTTTDDRVTTPNYLTFDDESPVKSTFSCNHCKKVFGLKFLLDIHVKIVHLKTLEQGGKVQCPECKKIFSARGITRHTLFCIVKKREMTNKKQTSYTCELCEKVWVKKESLTRHNRRLHSKSSASSTITYAVRIQQLSADSDTYHEHLQQNKQQQPLDHGPAETNKDCVTTLC